MLAGERRIVAGDPDAVLAVAGHAQLRHLGRRRADRAGRRLQRLPPEKYAAMSSMS